MERRSSQGFTLVELAIVAAIFLLVGAALMPLVSKTRQWAKRQQCGTNIRQLSLGLQRYARDHAGRFPDTLSALYPAYVAESKAFDCPASKKRGTPEAPDYEYRANLTVRSPGGETLVQDKSGNHRQGGKHIAKIDGAVEWVNDR